jgi:hypothetical protein
MFKEYIFSENNGRKSIDSPNTFFCSQSGGSVPSHESLSLGLHIRAGTLFLDYKLTGTCLGQYKVEINNNNNNYYYNNNNNNKRPGITNKILYDTKIKHTDRQQVQTLPKI